MAGLECPPAFVPLVAAVRTAARTAARQEQATALGFTAGAAAETRSYEGVASSDAGLVPTDMVTPSIVAARWMHQVDCSLH